MRVVELLLPRNYKKIGYERHHNKERRLFILCLCFLNFGWTHTRTRKRLHGLLPGVCWGNYFDVPDFIGFYRELIAQPQLPILP